MSNTLIKLTNICKNFADHRVLDHISLDIAPGQVIALLGPSGAGKSTLLRSINLLSMPDSGQLQIDGLSFDCRKKISHKSSQALRKQVSMVFQQFYLWPHKTVLKNITLAPTVVLKQKTDVAKQQALALLDKVKLANKANAYPLSLSGGEQQRVAIARALAMQPKVILLDEPTASLDPENTKLLLDIITTLAAEGMTLIISTHEMSFAQQVANRILFLEHGNIIADECADTMFQQSENQRFKQFISSL